MKRVTSGAAGKAWFILLIACLGADTGSIWFASTLRAAGPTKPLTPYEAADKELNVAFGEAKKRLPTAVPQLIASQKLWIAYRDLEANFAAVARKEDKNAALTRLTSQRTGQLRAATIGPADPAAYRITEPDKQLPSTLESLSAGLAPAGRAALQQAETAWLAFRDAETTYLIQHRPMEATFAPNVKFAMMYNGLTLARIVDLERYLQPSAGTVKSLTAATGAGITRGPGVRFLDRGKTPSATLNHHLATGREVSVSPSGQYMLEAGELYDLRTGLYLGGGGQLIGESEARGVKTSVGSLGVQVCFGPDDELAVGLPEWGATGPLKMLDFTRGEVLYTLDLPKTFGGVLSAAVSADKTAAVAAGEQGILVWQARTGEGARILNFPFEMAGSLLTRDGSSVLAWTRVSPTEIRALRWETATGSLQSDVHLPVRTDESMWLRGERIIGVRPDSDAPGPYNILKTDQHWVVEQWDAATGRPAGSAWATGEAVRSASTDLNGYASWFEVPGRGAAAGRVHTDWVLSPGGRWIAHAPGEDKGEIVVFDLDARKEAARVPVVAPGFCNAIPPVLNFTPDENFLVGSLGVVGDGQSMHPSIMPYDKVVLWDWRRGGGVAQTVESRFLNASAVTFSPDGADMIVGYENGTVRIFDAASNRLLRTFAPPVDRFTQSVEEGYIGVNQLAVSPDKRWLVTGDPENHVNLRYRTATFSVLDYQTGERFFTENQEATNENRLARDGRHLILSALLGLPGHKVLGGSAERVRVFDLERKEFVRWINGPVAGDVSADGRFLATVRAGGRVELWDLATGKLLDGAEIGRTFTGAEIFFNEANTLRFSGAGGLLAAVVHDRLNVWHCESGKLVPDPALAEPFNRRGYKGLLGVGSGYSTSAYSDIFLHGDEYLAAVTQRGKDTLLDLWRLADGKLARSDTPAPGTGFTLHLDASGEQAYLTGWTPAGSPPGGRSLLTFPPAGKTGDPEIKREAGPGGGLTASGVSDFAFSGRRAAWVDGGSVICANLDNPKPTAVLHSFYPTGEAFVAPDNLYAASRDVLRRIGALYAGRAFPFEQFDLRLNRPDVLAQRSGAPAGVVEVLRQTRERRLRRMGVSENMLGDQWHLPEVTIDRGQLPLSTPEEAITFDVQARDTQYALTGLNVFVNDVPVFGEAGMPAFPSGQTAAAVGAPLTRHVSLPLARGANKIQVSAVNAQGGESLRETIDVFGSGAPRAGKRTLALVVAGVSKYLDPDRKLDYADKDAGDLAAFFEKNHPGFEEVKVLRLLNGEVTREGLVRAAAFLRETKPDDRAIVFVAGHGLLDAKEDYYFGTVDMDFAHPEKRGASYDMLNKLLDAIPAREKLLMMDTCQAGELEKGQPAAAVPGLARGALGEWFADLRRGTGATIIASAGGMEPAAELDQLRNGVFTYYLLQGLRTGEADLDGDGQVRVQELRNYVAAQVRQKTQGLQSPTARRENLEANFVLMTAPRTADAAGRERGAVPEADNTDAQKRYKADADAARKVYLTGFAQAYVREFAGGAQDALLTLCDDKGAAAGPKMDKRQWQTRLAAEFARGPERQVETVGEPRIILGRAGAPDDVIVRLRCRIGHDAGKKEETRDVRLSMRENKGLFLAGVAENPVADTAAKP